MPVIECSTDCTVTVQLAPAPPQTDNVEAIGELFGLMLVACVVVWGCRQLLNIFTAPDER